MKVILPIPLGRGREWSATGPVAIRYSIVSGRGDINDWDRLCKREKGDACGWEFG